MLQRRYKKTSASNQEEITENRFTFRLKHLKNPDTLGKRKKKKGFPWYWMSDRRTIMPKR